MDLFTPVVPKCEQHPNFARLAGTPAYAPEREVISQWADGFMDRDGKFVKEFQTTYNSSYWELYLHACFRHCGYGIDFTVNRPDFVLSTPIGGIIAEATIASNPEGYRPEWERTLEDVSQPVENLESLVTLSCIRLANSIRSKHKKYIESYAQLPYVTGKPYVICIAPFEQPLYYLQNLTAIRRVLYGYDQPIYIDSPTSGERLIVGETCVDAVVKENRAKIPLGYFASPLMPEVSAVVFSSTFGLCKATALGGDMPGREVVFATKRHNASGVKPIVSCVRKKEYNETLLDGLHVFLNPYANTPLAYGFLQSDEVTFHGFDPTNSSYIVQENDGWLIQRECSHCCSDKNLIGNCCLPTDSGAYREYKHPEWEEGELIPVKADAWTWSHIHLAHYKGWTVLVGLDEVDQDYAALGRPGLHYTASSFIEANHKSDKGMLMLSECFTAKEDALRAAMREIDIRRSHNG